MLTINILCVGKIKEKYLQLAIEEYSKRLSKYCNLKIIEIPDEKVPDNINNTISLNIKEKEGNSIYSRISKDTYLICLDPFGKEYSSEEFSHKIEKIALNGNSSITFVIGGTLGISTSLLEKADEKISFSKMTFPHQLFRVFLLEQIFRAFKIQRGETYHR